MRKNFINVKKNDILYYVEIIPVKLELIPLNTKGLRFFKNNPFTYLTWNIQKVKVEHVINKINYINLAISTLKLLTIKTKNFEKDTLTLEEVCFSEDGTELEKIIKYYVTNKQTLYKILCKIYKQNVNSLKDYVEFLKLMGKPNFAQQRYEEYYKIFVNMIRKPLAMELYFK